MTQGICFDLKRVLWVRHGIGIKGNNRIWRSNIQQSNQSPGVHCDTDAHAKTCKLAHEYSGKNMVKVFKHGVMGGRTTIWL